MRGSAWVDSLSLASRGTIDQGKVNSSTGADAKEPRAPLSQATRGPEVKEEREPQESLCETTRGQESAEGESNSNLASGSSAEAGNLASDGVTVKTEGEKRKLADDETENETVKKVKIETKEEVDDSEGEEKRKPHDPMDIAVVIQGFPQSKITKSQANVLEGKLLTKLKRSPSEEPVQFLATNYEDGVVIFTCGNEGTKKWLISAVSQLDAWANFEAGPADIILHGAKLILWVSKLMKKRETAQILHLLEKQNKGLSTKEWSVVERRDLPRQASLVMWVDENSYKVLKQLNFRLHLGLGQATFKPAPIARSYSSAGPSRAPESRYVTWGSSRGQYRKYPYPKPPQLMQLSVRMPNTQVSRGYSHRGSNPSYNRRYTTPRSSQDYGYKYYPRNGR